MRSGSRPTGILAIALATLGFAAVPRAATLSDQVQRCVACHGANGAPQDNTTPVISGQHEGYLYLQLRDYKSGARKNDVMSPIAGELERADMMALAEYFAHQPWPNLRQPGASDAAATRALRASASVGCTGCHLGEYQGAGTQPRLSGQERDYLLRTMMDFRTGKRGNNPGMSSLMAAASEEDLVAMADLLAGR